ncbi:MAG TPA: carbohydrate porin [Chthonomonadaceae bacterium]|nr:carbohydrate porin [Chthonomonadaceae bacterium]
MGALTAQAVAQQASDTTDTKGKKASSQAGNAQQKKSPPGKAQAGEKKSQPESGDQSQEGKPLPQISPEARYDYQGEATFILQHLFAFRSPYEGANSLRSRNETELSDTYTLYLGARLARNLEVYIDPEIAWGNGLSGGIGLAGYTNGDIIGQPVLRPYPYLARYFVRWRVPMPHLFKHAGGEESESEQTGRAPNIIAGRVRAHRLVLQFGKMAVTDVFDTNSYANNPRTQFMNNAFGNNLAYDYAEETRGYDLGFSAAWVNPDFVVRLGTFAMPTTAGGPNLAYNFDHDHSEQVEVELHPALVPRKLPAVFRLLAFRNAGNMGSYRAALAAAPGMPPSTVAVEHPGAVKYGFGLNFEQALADGGATGIFGRLGWNNGATESYGFTDCDRFLSLGAQVAGTLWRRKDDRVGVAVAQSDISAAHRDYLAAGGLGLDVGDGKLNYSSERILETYYSYQLTKPLALTLDYQYISHPGYNRDRGPVSVVSARVHVSF